MGTPSHATGLSPRLFELMVRVSADGMLAIDEHGMVVFVNNAAAELLGRDAESLIGTQFGLPLVTDEAVEISLFHPRRGSRVAELRVARSEDGMHVAMIRDVSQRVRLRRELQRLALADELTGVGNRRAFLALGEQALRVAQREGRPAVLVFVDIDNMKMINDRHGHRAGDRAVIDTATMLTNTVRDSDIVARVGGDEFCVLLTGSASRPDSIEDALERLSNAANTFGNGKGFGLTVTWGQANYDPQEDPTIELLIERADAAMYASKQRKQEEEALEMVVYGSPEVTAFAVSLVDQAAVTTTVQTIPELLTACNATMSGLVIVGESLDALRALVNDSGGVRDNPRMVVLFAQSTVDIEAEEAALDLGSSDVINTTMSTAVAAARIRRALGSR